MEENVEDPEQGGGKAAGVWISLQSCCPIGVDLWCRDVGGYSLNGMVTGGFPIPGGVATDRADATKEVVHKVGVHLGGGGNRGGGV